MRIIGGAQRGHPLKTPAGDAIRPTSDKVRLAIFNALYSRGGVTDAIVLDAFCGTGALGLEALSQGATSGIFFDVAKASLSLAKENARALGQESCCHFYLKDATKCGVKPTEIPAATLVFLDPPYRKNLVPLTLDALKTGGWIAPDAMIVIETEEMADLPSNHGECAFDKTYGETRVRFLKA